MFKWKITGFKNKKNVDLWLEFLKLQELNNISFKWIKGHNNHPQNERCDHLALEASKKETLLIDRTYENQDNQNLL